MTGGGQSQATADRVMIYEREGDTKPLKRQSQKRKCDEISNLTSLPPSEECSVENIKLNHSLLLPLDDFVGNPLYDDYLLRLNALDMKSWLCNVPIYSQSTQVSLFINNL